MLTQHWLEALATKAAGVATGMTVLTQARSAFGRAPSKRSLVGATFAYLSQLSTGQQYQQVLQAWAPQAHTVQLQNLLNTAPYSLGSSIECPADLSTKVLQMDFSCVWVRGAGTWASQSAQDGDPGATLTGISTWLGGQKQLAPGWFLGGAFGDGQSWANANDSSGNFSSNGEVYNGRLSLRHRHKARSVSGSLPSAAATSRTRAPISVPPQAACPAAAAPTRAGSAPG